MPPFASRLAAILTLFAAALPAHADYLYSLQTSDTFAGGLGNFQLTVPDLITTDTVFQLSDFDSITPLAGTTSISFDFGGFDTTIWYDGTGQGIFWAGNPAFSGPGTYCSGVGNCDTAAGIMTVREVGRVPEPGALALVGAALGAAGWTARRRQAARR